MILSIFKKNNLASFIVMVFIALLLWADGFIFSELHDYGKIELTPLFSWLMDLLPENKLFRSILAFGCIVVQALMINYNAEKHKVVRKKKMLPGLVYIVLMSMHTSMLGLHPALLANFFLIMALSTSMGELSGKMATLHIFKLGLFVSMAGFLFFPAYLLFFLAFLQKGIFSASRIRGFFSYILGFGAPFFFAANYYFHLGILDERLAGFLSNLKNFGLKEFSFEPISLVLFVYTGLIVLISTVYLSFSHTSATTTTMRSRLANIGIFFLLTVVVFFIGGGQLTLSSSLVFVPSSIALAVWLIEQRKKWFAEAVFVILLLIILLSKSSNSLF